MVGLATQVNSGGRFLRLALPTGAREIHHDLWTPVFSWVEVNCAFGTSETWFDSIRAGVLGAAPVRSNDLHEDAQLSESERPQLHLESNEPVHGGVDRLLPANLALASVPKAANAF